jgi:hypothetical protein
MHFLFMSDENSLGEPQELVTLRNKFPNAMWWRCGMTKFSLQLEDWCEENGVKLKSISNPQNVKDYPYAFFQYFDRVIFVYGNVPSPNMDKVDSFMKRAKADKIPNQRLMKPYERMK